MTGFEWRQPDDLELPDHGEFPVDVLPAALRDVAIARAKELSVDPEMVVGGMLPTIAAACGAAKIHVNPGWEEAGPVWTLVAADPGSRKSAAFKTSLAALKSAQKEAIEHDKLTRPGKAIRVRRAEKSITDAEREYESLLDGDGDEPPSDEALAAAEEAVNVAHRERLRVVHEVGAEPLIDIGGFATSEKLHDLLAEHKNLLMSVPEGDTMFVNWVNGRLDRDVFLQPWSMEDHSRKLVGRAVSTAEDPSLHLSIVTQTKVVLDTLKNQGGDRLQFTGMFDRFDVFVPRTDQLQETTATSLSDITDIQTFLAARRSSPEVERLYQVVSREVRRTLPLRGEATHWALDAEAAVEFQRRHDYWAAYKASYTSECMGTLAKLAGKALRYSRVFAQVEMDDPNMDMFGGNVTPLDSTVLYPLSASAVAAGWDVAWFCFRRAEYLFGDALSDDVASIELARKVLRKARQLSDEGETTFTARRLARRGLARYRVADLTKVLDELTAHRWFTAVHGERGSAIYHTHPEITKWIEKYGI